VLGQKALSPDLATFVGERLTGMVAGPAEESSRPATMMARYTAAPKDTSRPPIRLPAPPPLYVHPAAVTRASTPGPALPKGHKKGTGRGRSGGARPI
jgi:hypothetical protein